MALLPVQFFLFFYFMSSSSIFDIFLYEFVRIVYEFPTGAKYKNLNVTVRVKFTNSFSDIEWSTVVAGSLKNE